MNNDDAWISWAKSLNIERSISNHAHDVFITLYINHIYLCIFLGMYIWLIFKYFDKEILIITNSYKEHTWMFSGNLKRKPASFFFSIWIKLWINFLSCICIHIFQEKGIFISIILIIFLKKNWGPMVMLSSIQHEISAVSAEKNMIFLFFIFVWEWFKLLKINFIPISKFQYWRHTRST